MTELPPALAERVLREDAVALSLLVSLAHEAACTLGLSEGGFGELHEAWSHAAASCSALGNEDHAQRIRADHPASVPVPPLPVETSLESVLEFDLRVEEKVLGESMVYRFAHPNLLEAIENALAAPTKPSGGSSDKGPGGAKERMERVGSSVWASSRGGVFRFSAPPETDLASLEVAADEHISAWRTSMSHLPPEVLEPGLKAVVLSWVRTSVYTEAAERALESGGAGSAVTLFEEALGTARPRPGPGRDPVLLCELASARWRAGEYARAVELLRDIGTQPGWRFAEIPAEMIARVAVIPSATDPRVRR